MNLEQLEAINAVAEQGSFRAAAEKLNRSQPALSATIKQLEEEFNILIFDRSDYRPKLTEAGAAFLGFAKQTLESAQYAARVAVELGKNKAETKICISVDPLISTEVIEQIAQECCRPTLPVNLVIDKSIFKASHEPLMNGEIDLAIAPRPENSNTLEAISLEEVQLVGVISRRLLQEKKKPDATYLNSRPQILVYDRHIDKAPEASHGHKIFVPDHFTKLKLIESGIGWGRISKTEFENNTELVQIEKSLCTPLTLELCLLRPKQRAIGPIAQAIWRAFETRKNK